MLDLTGLLNQASNMFKGSSFDDVLGTDVSAKLSEFGLDETLRDGVQAEELQTLLDNIGLDLSSLDGTQLAELVNTLKENESPDGIDISNLFDQSKG